jgi:hypothetical protein
MVGFSIGETLHGVFSLQMLDRQFYAEIVLPGDLTAYGRGRKRLKCAYNRPRKRKIAAHLEM